LVDEYLASDRSLGPRLETYHDPYFWAGFNLSVSPDDAGLRQRH